MLEIQNLTRPGLAPANLSLHRGECVALSGPSGSGKSIFMRAIADLDPNTGEVSLDGRPREAVAGPDWLLMILPLSIWSKPLAPPLPWNSPV